MPSRRPLAIYFGRLSQIAGIVIVCLAFGVGVLSVLSEEGGLAARPTAFAFLLAGAMLFLAGRILHRVERQHNVAQQALRDSEALYHSLVEGLPLNIFRKDRA